MIRVAYLTNATADSGVGYRAAAMHAALTARPAADLVLDELAIDGQAGLVRQADHILLRQRAWPGLLGTKTLNWIRLGRAVQQRLAREDTYDIWHATNQTLSFITAAHTPSIVTVHDIIELLEPQSRLGGLAARYLYRGLTRAAHIIAVSEFSARTLTEYCAIPPDRITVIPNGVGPEFHPITNFRQTVGGQTLRQALKLNPEQGIILYVGSDHPRKNVSTVIDVLAQLRHRHPDLVLIKVGEPGLPAEREKLLTAIDARGMRDHVRFLGRVTTTRLNELYNLAGVLLFPSRLEGFGLPPLQALAAGLPVVCSNATSLPEVVGDAALMASPDDGEALASHVERILSDPSLAAQLREKGLARAAECTWQRAADRERAVYQALMTA